MNLILKQLLEKAEFQQESTLRDHAVVNASIPHTQRDEPAWHYSVIDANLGAKEENSRLLPIIKAQNEALEKAIGALKDSREGHAQIIRHSNDILGKKNSTHFMSGCDEALSEIETLLKGCVE